MTVKEEGILAFVPALSVFKDGAVLSNIFLSDPEWEDEEGEIILKLGRHPACDIVLDHPSISRWHLQIQLQNSSQELLLTDLSSVNGTFVCGQRATPKLPITLRLNDTFTMGASTRVYKFQWLPFPSEEEEDCTTPPLSRIVSTHEMKYGFNDGNEERVSMEERHANGVESISRNLAPSLSDIVLGHDKQDCGHNNKKKELASMRKEYFKADESIVLSNLKRGFNYENKGQFSKAEIPTLSRIVSEPHEMKYGFNDENEEQVSMEERHANAAESISRNLAPTLSGIISEHDKQEGGHDDENKELASKQKEYVKADESIVLRSLVKLCEPMMK
ncbi:uncharacterized protein LOC131032805 [Cryptomeria japonica]|uniref:uncharacterized protein LOC131032805 n=1 Tax=Cryptomeria japonica TaxID=3369 RepID=UPI0027DA8636|nr:uncharacterized protein LOC131032805 [Cryptomeria japonica]